MQKYKSLVSGTNKNEGSGLLRTKKSVAISLHVWKISDEIQHDSDTML